MVSCYDDVVIADGMGEEIRGVVWVAEPYHLLGPAEVGERRTVGQHAFCCIVSLFVG